MPQAVRGAIHIANEVLADIVGFTALSAYGVVDMAVPDLVNGVAQLLPRKRLRKGVSIANSDSGVQVDLYIIAEHGTQLAEVSRALSDRIRYELESTADVAVSGVEVHVMGVKVRGAK